ncbi:MAG: hydroxysqualene dehydroxylase HpnE [Burkholderiales bacterium]|jgi:squalene-associated FAD-dependent desaturase|nr:hydroxysqualene dehydroxylase HpnE [Betaproteobacteria bacterium]
MKQAKAACAGANIAVIGGGYSGMAAAVRVVELGANVTVFEAAPVLGGRARRIEYQGHTLDNGQHILSGAYRELLRLFNVVDVPSRAYERVPLALAMPPHFSLRAPLLPAPLHMAMALLTAKGLSWSDRILAVRFMAKMKKAAFQCAGNLTVARLLQDHHQSATLTKFLWQPLSISALNTPLATASAQVFLNVLRDALAGEREASDLLLPKVDLTALFPEPAARWLAARGCNTHTGSRVTNLQTNEREVSFMVKDRLWSFDAAIVAVGPRQRGDVIPYLDAPPGSTALQYEPIVTIYLCFTTDIELPMPMFGQAEGCVQWFFDRRALSLHRTEKTMIVAGVISASGAHDKMSHEELAAVAVAELRNHLPDLPDPDWHKVVTEKFATFACTPDTVRLPTHTHLPNLFLAGDDIQNPERAYPATLEGAVRNGVSAAEQAVASISKRHRSPLRLA